jgi:TolB-like protein
VARFGHVCPTTIGSVPDRLESWKEIASYLNKSVRTVRRWESDEGLPVHRHMHQSLGSVYAYKSELDAWRGSGERARRTAPSAPIERSIAVLPFRQLSGGEADEYFADGLTEEVIAGLSKVQSMRVISSTSSRTFKGTQRNARAIGRELGVRFIVEGTVRRAESRLRVSARLIDTSNDDHLWSDRYDGTIEDVFDIQEKLARTIVDALELQLTADEDRRLSARPIANVHAYECFIQARQAAFRWRRDSIDHAVQLLQNGLKLVGENAELYAALGRAHLQYRESGIDFSERPIVAAEQCAAKVSLLDARSPAGQLLRGWIEYSKGDIQSAVRELKAILDTEWNNPDVLALLSNCYLISGRVDEARPLIAQLLAIDPLTPLSRCMPGFADLMEGGFAAAVGPYRDMFEMDPDNPMGRLFYTWVLAMAGDTQEAIAIADASNDSVPGRVTMFLARSLTKAEPLPNLEPDVHAVATATEVFSRFLAHGYARRGMVDEAMQWLSVAVNRGFINYRFIAEHDPALRSLHDDSRFRELLQRVHKRWSSFEA